MNNDNFDNKIRKKVLDFEPDYEEVAWQKFSPQLAPGYKAPAGLNLKKWGFYSGIAAAAVLIVFLSFQNYQLSHPQKPESVAEVKKETLQKETIQKNPSAEKVSPPVAVPPDSPSAKEKTKTSPSLVGSTKENVSTKTTSSAAFTPKPQTKTPVKEEISLAQPGEERKNNNYSPEMNNTPPSFPLKEEKKTMITENSSVQEPYSPKMNESYQSVVSETEKNTVKPEKSSEKKSLAIKNPIRRIQSEYITNLKVISASQDIALENNGPILPSRKPLVRIKPSCSAGISYAYMEDKSLLGITGNIGITPRLSMNIGIDYNLIPPKVYADELEYNIKNDTQFSAIVPTDVQMGASYSAIREDKRQWDAVISVQYRQPVWRQLSIVANLGKRVLLNSRDRFSYKYQSMAAGGPPEPKEESFYLSPQNHGKRNAPVWAGIGLQYDWKRVQFGVMPQLMLSDPKVISSQNRDPNLSASIQVKTAFRIF